MSRKDEILEIIIKKFQDEGFSMDITMSKLAEQVNIGKSTIYEYFKTKDDIFKEAIFKMIDNHVDATMNIGDIESMSFEEAFLVQCRSLLFMARQSRMVMEVFTKNFVHRMPDTMAQAMKEKMENIRELISRRFEAIFEKGVAEGVVQETQDPVQIEMAAGILVGCIVRYSDPSTSIDLDRYTQAIYESIIKLNN